MSSLGQSFGDYLYELIHAAGMTVEQFAEEQGVYKSDLSAIRAGRRTVPEKHLNKWCKALGLTGAERERFLDLAAIDWSPERMRTLVQELETGSGKTIRELRDSFN